MWTFTREAAVGIVRTAATYVYAWLLSLSTVVADFAAELNITEEGFVLVAGTLLYIAVRQVAEKVPAVGNLLVFNTAPKYDE